AAFPLLYDLESKHGSVLKGLMALMKQRKQALPPGKPRSSPFGQLCSFRRGMQQLPQEIYSRYQHHIHLGEDVMGMKKEGGGYVIETPKVKYFADQVFICTPAYTAARLIADANAEVCGLLKKIEYVPILVAGLVYHTKDLKKIPEGFGYLVPTEGNSEILGVLFSGNIFPGHTEPEKFLFRVLIRPGRPDIDPRTFLPTAIEEVRSRFSITADPVERCYSYLAHAIPLYGLEHPRITEQLAAGMRDLPNCHLAGNYLGGISVADCIQNTKGLVEESDG
ncbi:MAG: protoporphyrinogen oxidase, partial [Candidatus Omnitrophota bacterium]|nr:protoporphyrinogen oxidase [Candidatus Omnitrophota bacterium]